MSAIATIQKVTTVQEVWLLSFPTVELSSFPRRSASGGQSKTSLIVSAGAVKISRHFSNRPRRLNPRRVNESFPWPMGLWGRNYSG